MADNRNTIATNEVIHEVADRMGCYKKDAREVLEHFVNVVLEGVAAGKRVRFAPLGTFELRLGRPGPGTSGNRGMMLKLRPARSVVARPNACCDLQK